MKTNSMSLDGKTTDKMLADVFGAVAKMIRPIKAIYVTMSNCRLIRIKAAVYFR